MSVKFNSVEEVKEERRKLNEKFGGNLEFNSYKDLENTFVDGLHPLDLKNATASYVNKILEPVHQYFEKHPENYKNMKEVGIIQ